MLKSSLNRGARLAFTFYKNLHISTEEDIQAPDYLHSTREGLS